MGAGCANCYDSESKPPSPDTDKLNDKYSKLTKKYESACEEKSNLMNQIQVSTNKFNELMNSQLLLNENYENEIMKWQTKVSQLEDSQSNENDMDGCDEYKQFQNDNKSEHYQQIINELTQEINKLNQEIKLLQIQIQKNKHVSFPVPVNDKILMSKLKLEVASLKNKLKRHELRIQTCADAAEASNTSLLSTVPGAATPQTEFNDAVMHRYNTNSYEASTDVFEGIGDVGYGQESDPNESSSLEMPERLEIEARKSERKQKKRIMDDFEEMKKEMHSLKRESINVDDDGVHTDVDIGDEELDQCTGTELPPLVTKSNLFRPTSQSEWGNLKVKNLKKEMGQQMIHLVSESISSEHLDGL